MWSCHLCIYKLKRSNLNGLANIKNKTVFTIYLGFRDWFESSGLCPMAEIPHPLQIEGREAHSALLPSFHKEIPITGQYRTLLYKLPSQYIAFQTTQISDLIQCIYNSPMQQTLLQSFPEKIPFDIWKKKVETLIMFYHNILSETTFFLQQLSLSVN